MLFGELEGSTIEELIVAFRGPPLDGEADRESFYEDVADEIARLGGVSFLAEQLCNEDQDRMVAAIGALAFSESPAVDRSALLARLRRLLEHPKQNARVTALQSLGHLEDRTVRDRVLALLASDPSGLVRARALGYLRVLFPGEALPLLIEALRDPDATVRFTAVDELVELEQFTDRTTFERMLADPEEDVRAHARYILDNHLS